MATAIESAGGASPGGAPHTPMITPLGAATNRLATMANSCPDALARLTLNGHFTEVNPAMERMVGWRPDVIQGRSILSLAHPSDRPAIEMRLGRLLSSVDGPDPQSLHERILFRARRVDARYSWLEAHLRVETSERGRVMGLIGSLRDVDHQREAALQQRERVGDWAALAQLGQVVASGADRHAILKAATGQLLAVLPAHAILAVQLSDRTALCTNVALREPHPNFAPEHCAVPLDGDTPAARALRTGQPAAAPYSASRSEHGRSLARLWSAGAAAPISSGETTWGALVALTGHGTPPLTSAQERVLALAADVVALGLGRS